MSASTPRPGRRAAPRRSRASRRPRSTPHLSRSGLTAAALVLAAAVAALLVEVETLPRPEEPPPAPEPVRHTLYACPRVLAGTEVLTLAAAVPDLGGGGGIRAGAPGDRAADEPASPKRGEVVRLEPGSRDAPTVVVEARGELAAGLVTAQATRDTGEGTLAAAGCPGPAAQWWFTGAGATLDHSSELVLANLDVGPAVVDLTVLGPEGEVETLGTRGLVVRPGETTTVPLTDVAPQTEEVAVAVSASRGRVVAGLEDRFAAGPSAETGVEWVPDQPAPARLVRLTGLPVEAARRTLVVANPSPTDEAVVEVQVAGSAGTYTPAGLEPVRVPPGSVATADVGAVLEEGEPAGLVLRANVPVTASVRSVQGGDTSYAVPALPLTGPAAAPVFRDTTAEVVLTGGPNGATVGVLALDADGGEVAAKTLEVDPGATVAWEPGRRAASLVVDPTAGRVSGAVLLDGAGGVAQLPLDDLPLQVRRPVVRPLPG